MFGFTRIVWLAGYAFASFVTSALLIQILEWLTSPFLRLPGPLRWLSPSERGRR